MWDLRGRAKLQTSSRRKTWKATRGHRFVLFMSLHRLQIIQPQLLTPRLCTAPTGNNEDGQPQKSKIKTPFETQNSESWAGRVIPFSKTLTLDEYGTPEQLWLKVKMRPDGIYVTESEGGRCSVTLAWSNKGQGGRGNCWMWDGGQSFSAGSRVVAPASHPL